MSYVRKSYGSRTGLRYKTVGPPANYRRISYRKPMVLYRSPRPSTVSRFQSPREIIEWKNIDTSFSAVPLQVSPTFTPPVIVNNISQGTTAASRLGRRVLFKSMHYRFTVSGGAIDGGGGSSAFSQVRILVVYDRQTNSALPSTTEIVNTATIDGLIQLNESRRWVVLSDKVYAQESFVLAPLTMTCYEKMSLDTQYNGPGGTIADVTLGGIYVLLAHNGSYTTAPAIDGHFRLRFTDP